LQGGKAMSLKAITWAFDQEIGSSAAKFVLVALSDNADQNGEAWPCIKEIERKTQLERKTIIKALDFLQSKSLINDTGKRKGRTGRVPIYQLAIVPKTEQFHKRNDSVFTHPIVPETERLNSAKNGTRNPHIGTLKEPSLEKVSPKRGGSTPEIPPVLFNVPGFCNDWLAFIEHRKKKGCPATYRAQELILNRLCERPRQALAALQTAIIRGWQGFEWSWFDKDKNGTNGNRNGMTYNQKERRINQLNERKAQLMRYPVDDTGNPVDRNISRELHQIDLELSKL